MENLQIFLHTDPYSMTARLTPSSCGGCHSGGGGAPTSVRRRRGFSLFEIFGYPDEHMVSTGTLQGGPRGPPAAWAPPHLKIGGSVL